MRIFALCSPCGLANLDTQAFRVSFPKSLSLSCAFFTVLHPWQTRHFTVPDVSCTTLCNTNQAPTTNWNKPYLCGAGGIYSWYASAQIYLRLGAYFYTIVPLGNPRTNFHPAHLLLTVVTIQRHHSHRHSCFPPATCKPYKHSFPCSGPQLNLHM